MKVLAISYAKRALETGSREQIRMQKYAEMLDEYVLIVFTRKKDSLPKEFLHGNLRIIGTNARTRVGMLAKAFLLSRKITKRKKDWIISSQDPYESSLISYLLCLFSKNKLHIQIHSDPFAQPDTIVQKVRSVWMRFVLSRAQKIRVVSKRVHDALIATGVSRSVIHIVPIQADLSDFISVGRERAYASKKDVTYLAIGRFVSGKNMDLIIRAFAHVYAANPESHLILVGDGPLRSSIEKLVQKCEIAEAVSIESWTNDIVSFVSRADVLVVASAHEGYGLVLMEAAAAGMSIISTDVGCIGWLLHDGEECAVVTPEIQSIVSAMRFFADEKKRESFGKRAYTKAGRTVSSEKAYLEQWRDSF